MGGAIKLLEDPGKKVSLLTLTMYYSLVFMEAIAHSTVLDCPTECIGICKKINNAVKIPQYLEVGDLLCLQ